MNISKIVGWWPQALIYSLMSLSAAFGSRYDTRAKVKVEIDSGDHTVQAGPRTPRAELLHLRHGRHRELSNPEGLGSGNGIMVDGARTI